MKAAVLHALGTLPRYEDFPEPVLNAPGQLILNMTAAAVKNLDKGRAGGSHYARHENLPEVVGNDGVGRLEDGTRVYAHGLSGMIAQRAVIDKNSYTRLPDAIDDIQAAALPNAIMGAALALKYRAVMQPGQTVLINGATGVTGQAAVQIARHYGAGKIIATGRNPEMLARLPQLGADEVVSLSQPDEAITEQLRKSHNAKPIDIVIDYLWGHPAALILDTLKGGGLHTLTGKVRFVTVGGMAGDKISLSSGLLRSTAIELCGSGLGSLPAEALKNMHTETLPEMLHLAADGKLHIETVTAPLSDIETAWAQDIPAGKRLVILI